MFGLDRDSILLQHNFRGLDDGEDLVTNLELHFFRTSFRYHALNQILSDSDNNVSHNSAELEFNDLAFETISR